MMGEADNFIVIDFVFFFFLEDGAHGYRIGGNESLMLFYFRRHRRLRKKKDPKNPSPIFASQQRGEDIKKTQ